MSNFAEVVRVLDVSTTLANSYSVAGGAEQQTERARNLKFRISWPIPVRPLLATKQKQRTFCETSEQSHARRSDFGLDLDAVRQRFASSSSTTRYRTLIPILVYRRVSGF
jgi:hypothetical protein